MRWLILLTVSLLPGTIAAQTETDQDVVALIAVAAIQREFLDGQPFTLDPEYGQPMERDHQITVPPRTIPQHIVSRAGAAGLLRIGDAKICEPKSPPSCRMRRGIAAIAVSLASIEGDVASVWVEVRRSTTSTHSPVQELTIRVDLRRTEGRWSLVSTMWERVT